MQKMLEGSSESIEQCWKSSLDDAAQILERCRRDPEFLKGCFEFSRILIQAFRRGSHVFACGNGGSHCDAMHFAEELTGRYRKSRPPLGALALGDPSHITCVANDYGFEQVFLRQIQALGRPGDVLIGLSTSGNSPNLIRAFEWARDHEITCIGLLGRDGGGLKSLAHLSIVVPAQTSDRIQEMHIKLLHTVIESVERSLYPELY